MGVLGRGQPRTDYVAPPQSLYWIRQVLEGLAHLHLTLQFIWLDLKPDNILLSSTDDVKLSAFSLSRCEEYRNGQTWELFIPPGSPGYCAPEVLHQEPFTCTADLYSFG